MWPPLRVLEETEREQIVRALGQGKLGDFRRRGQTRYEALHVAGSSVETRDSNHENGREPLDDKLVPARFRYISHTQFASVLQAFAAS